MEGEIWVLIMRIWNENRNEIEGLVNELVKFVSENGLEFSLRTEILMCEVLYSKKSIEFTSGMLLSSIIEFSKQESNGFKEFEKILLATKAERVKKNNLNMTMAQVFYPFNVDIRKRKIRLDGHTVRFYSKNSQVYQNLLTTKFKKKVFDYFFPFKGSIQDRYFEVEVQAYDANNAFLKTEYLYDLLRGIVDFSINSRRIKMVSGLNSRSSIRELSHVLVRGKSYAHSIDGFLELGLVKNSHHKLSDQEKRIFEIVAKPLEDRIEKNSINNLLKDCLVLYGQALLAYRPQDYFIHLWQILERITCSTTGSTQIVVKRANQFLGYTSLKGSGWKNTLRHLAQERNNLVHEGRFQIDSNELEILNLICQLGIAFIVNEYTNLVSEEDLKDYYEVKSWSESKFKRLGNITTKGNVSLKI